MSKEYIQVKAEDISKLLYEVYDVPSGICEQIKNMQQRLEAIDKIEPSEALECLERIDNTLYLNNIKDKLEFGIDTEEHTDCDSVIGMIEDLETIKQALIKAEKEHNSLNLLMQELDCKYFETLRKYARCGYDRLNNFKGSKKVKIEIPESSLMDYNPVKQYLKWEDLEFDHKPKYIDVKMNGNKYKLVVGYNVAGKNLAILRDSKKEYYFLEADKQFFNDLHLERVEE